MERNTPTKNQKITDRTLIDFFKQRNNVITNDARLGRIVPKYNKIFRTELPTNAEGTAQLRAILTADYLQSREQSPEPEPVLFTEPERTAEDEANLQREYERLLLLQRQTELSSTLQNLIRANTDVALSLPFEVISREYQYSIPEFIELFLDYNPHTEALADRIVILSVYAPNQPRPEHIFLLTRTGALNLTDYLRGSSQYNQDSNEAMNRLFNSFNEGFTFKIENRKRIKGMKGIRKEGEYFNYLHKTEIDLTKCGIFNNQQYNLILEEGMDTYRYDILTTKGCLYYALFQNLETCTKCPYIIEDLQVIFTNIYRTSLKIETVLHVAKELKITISLKYNDGFKNRSMELNKGCTYTCHLGMLADHYFLDYKTDHTVYAVNNYFDICKMKDYNYIYASQGIDLYKRDNTGKRFITSYAVVEHMLKQKETFLEDLPATIEKADGETSKQLNAVKITEEQLKIALSKIDDDQIYDYNTDVAQRAENLQKRLDKDDNLNADWIPISCDLETITDQTTLKIKAVASFYKLPNLPTKSFKGFDCVEQLLKSLPNNAVLYFHNTKFDISHFQPFFTDIMEYVENEGRFIYQKAKYYRKQFYIIDTCNYLPGSLKSIAKDYNLTVGKEIMNYQIYNQLTNRELSIGKWFRNVDVDKEIYGKDGAVFLENIEKWKLRRPTNPKEYDALTYLTKYGEMDVVVLQQIYETFAKSILATMGINILFGEANGFKLYPTVSSISREYAKKQGCLNGVCSNMGVIREFIDGALVGGRTMLKNNSKVIRKPNQKCIDYTSLYPSAMNEGEGFAVGKPTFFSSMEGVGNCYFVAKIRIGKGLIKTRLNYPVISKITKREMLDIDGKRKRMMSRCFTNDFVAGEEVIVDKYTLEDAVNFQGLDYSLVHGIVWLGGWNTKVKDVIQHCFNTRNELKRLGNTAGQLAYKLVMNSLYGFTAEKPHMTKINIVKAEDIIPYVLSHSKRVCSASKIGDSEKYLVKSSEDINKHSNYNHIAVGILSFSKRLMNEVFVLADENNISMEYSDTDSIFMDGDDLDALEKQFKLKYSKDLINQDGALNTFKVDMDDFVVRGVDGKYVKTSRKELGFDKNTIVGGEAIYLGKKTYLMEVKHTEDVDFRGYIFSSKGITDTSLFHYCNKKEVELGSRYDLKDLYLDLANNAYVEIDLCEDGSKYRVEYRNTASFQKTHFTRRIGGFAELDVDYSDYPAPPWKFNLMGSCTRW